MAFFVTSYYFVQSIWRQHLALKNTFPRLKEYFCSFEKKILFLVWKNTFHRVKAFFPGEEDVLLECQAHSKSKTQKNRFEKKTLCPHWGLRTPQSNQILFNQVKMEAWLHYRPWALPASIPTLYCHQLRRWEKQNYKITEIIRIMDAVSCQHSLQRQVSKISSYVAVSNSFSQNHRENALYLFFRCLCVYLCLSLSPSPHLSLSFPCSFKINSVTHSVSDRVNIT